MTITASKQLGAGSTNWAAIREQCEDYNVSAPDETGPARILALLAQIGLDAKEENGLVLLTPARPLPSTIALVSASELFAWDELQEARIERRRVSRVPGAGDLFSKKVALWKQSYRTLSGPHAYLYVVDLDNWLADTTNEAIALMTEQDDRVVRKFICRSAELAQLLANPFGKTYAGPHRPKFEVHRRDRASFDPPAPDFAVTVTHPFTRVVESWCWLERLHLHPEAARLLEIANSLARRIMGADYRLPAAHNEVMLQRWGKCTSVPYRFLGTGEQYGLAFCAYLALAVDEATPDTWLGISEVLNYLDLTRYLAAMDVLRDFVVATGANVYFMTNKGDYRELATAKLKAAAATLESLTA